MAQGYRTDNPAGDALLAALPRRPTPVRHRRALSHGIRLAFEFLVLTATRSAEVRLATWREIDLVSMVWTIPEERMKAKREHRIPLNKRAIEVLRAAEQLRPSPQPTSWCSRASAGDGSTPRSSRRMITRLGIDAVPHGFR